MLGNCENILGKELMNNLVNHFQTVFSKKYDKIIFSTEKGYWLYRIAMQDCRDAVPYQTKDTYCGSDLESTLDNNWVKGQRIFLADTMIGDGYSIFRHYCILRKMEAKEVVPIVFALSTDYPQKDSDHFMEQIFREVNPDMDEEQAKTETAAAINGFYDTLYCGRYMAPSGIGEFCVKEMELFQKSLCPMSIDLPIIVSKPRDGRVLVDNFVIGEDKFLHLCCCEGESKWTYVGCGYVSNESAGGLNDVHGKVRKTIQCNYFEYRDKVIEPMFDTFLQNMVVKCKYNRNKDGSYRAIFTPFAIVRSWDKAELKKAVQVLLTNEGSYKKRLLNELDKDKVGTNAWDAALRSVIYILSLYVGEKFRLLLLEYGIQSGYDSTLIKSNSEKGYNDMMLSYEEKNPDEEGSVDNAVKSYSAQLSQENGMSKKAVSQSAKVGKRKTPNLQDAYYNCIWPMLQEKQDDRRIPDVISLEDIESALENRYDFLSDSDKRHTVTGIMLLMLENSTFGNMVEVRGNKAIRGFRRGENSQFLIAPAAQVCYSCAEILYVSAGEERYHKFFDAFFEKMKQYVKACGFLGEQGNEESFDIAIKWFRSFKDEDLYSHIEGNRFLLKNLSIREEKVRDEAKTVVEKMIISEDGYKRKLY